MNLLLLEERDRTGGDRFTVRGPRAAHARLILNAQPGSQLRVGLLEGPVGLGRVLSLDHDQLELECALDPALTPPRPLLDLILAVPRPKMLRRLLPEIAALGVDRLILLRTWRVAKPYLSADVLEPALSTPLLHEGLMQARSTRAPIVSLEPLFKPFVEDRARALFAGARCLIAHPIATRALADLPAIAADERIALAIGPEGGFIPFEVQAFADAGFERVSLGPRTLRVDTAVVALLAQLDLLRARRR